MAKFAKWIGGGLGWAFFGPIGAIVGFTLGTLVDHTEITGTSQTGSTTTGDFVLSLLVLSGAVMKADKRVMKSELEYVKQFFIRSFGYDTASEAMLMLRDVLKQPISVKEVSDQIKNHLDYASRLQLLHFLFGIAAADGSVDSSEKDLIIQIASFMGIESKDIGSVQSMFIPDTDWAYQVLEISRSATPEEIKKAYHRLAVKNHPDKVAYLGEDIKKAATEKFRKINEAYETIKKERQIN